MTGTEYSFAAMITFGGLALFLLGMDLMVDGLQNLAGFQLRALVSRLTRRVSFGVIGGTISGALIHSGPTTVMVVGFVNAGMLTLAQSLGLIYGANIGTTLSMQVIAFDIGQFCFLALGVGVIMRLLSKGSGGALRSVSLIVIGFGLLFLGMETMKHAMAPLKQSEALMTLLSALDATTLSGMLLATVAATLLTAVLQSSGATISLVFSLSALGIITDLRQTFPFILGAHIGTCAPTLLSAIGTTVNARRAALAHLMFNVIGSVIAIFMVDLYMDAVPRTSDNLVRQVANAHTGVQVVNTLIFLPLSFLFAKFICLMAPSRGESETSSHLDPGLIRTPEMAILAVIKELRRAAHIANAMLTRSLDGLVSLDLRKFHSAEKDEQAIDIIKHQVDRYISQIGERRLSPRQVMLLQRLIIVSNSLERVGDHIETIGTLSRIKIHRRIWFDDESMVNLLELSQFVSEMLTETMDSIDPTEPGYREKAQEVLKLRKRYKRKSEELKDRLEALVERKGSGAVTAMFFLRYVVNFDRMVHHVRAIARQELKDAYIIKEWKLSKPEPLAPREDLQPMGNVGHPSMGVAISDLIRRVEEERQRAAQPDPDAPPEELFPESASSGEHPITRTGPQAD